MLYSPRPSGSERASRRDSGQPLYDHIECNDDVNSENSVNEGFRPEEPNGQTTEPYSASIEEVKTRGTGNYKCSHGRSCQKGGVGSDGAIRIFTRNSDFKCVALLPCLFFFLFFFFEHLFRLRPQYRIVNSTPWPSLTFPIPPPSIT